MTQKTVLLTLKKAVQKTNPELHTSTQYPNEVQEGRNPVSKFKKKKFEKMIYIVNVIVSQSVSVSVISMRCHCQPGMMDKQALNLPPSTASCCVTQ